MRRSRITLLLFSLTFALACGAHDDGARQNAQATATPVQSVDADATKTSAAPLSLTCALLSRADVESVQGEAFAEAQGSEHLGDGLVKSQCFYRLSTFDKSFTLEVVRADTNVKAVDALREFWREKFSPEAIESREREREGREKRERAHERELERERASGQVREGGHTEEEEREDEEETERPRRVERLGDAAFWTGGERGGSLYILLKDASIRISVGGVEDEPARRAKAVALARKILTHF